jgi:hypothetical protein
MGRFATKLRSNSIEPSQPVIATLSRNIKIATNATVAHIGSDANTTDANSMNTGTSVVIMAIHYYKEPFLCRL